METSLLQPCVVHLLEALKLFDLTVLLIMKEMVTTIKEKITGMILGQTVEASGKDMMVERCLVGTLIGGTVKTLGEIERNMNILLEGHLDDQIGKMGMGRHSTPDGHSTPSRSHRPSPSPMLVGSSPDARMVSPWLGDTPYSAVEHLINDGNSSESAASPWDNVSPSLVPIRASETSSLKYPNFCHGGRGLKMFSYTRLLQQAHDPANRPAFEVRLVQASPVFDGHNDDSSLPDSPTNDDTENTNNTMRQSIHLQPSSGSSHNLKAPELVAGRSHDPDGREHCNCQFMQYRGVDAFSNDFKKYDFPGYAILNTSKGLITVELYKDASPEIVDRFLDLWQYRRVGSIQMSILKTLLKAYN